MGTQLTFGLKRALYPPSAGKGIFHGDDVLALKGVVSRAGFWPWQEFDEDYSEKFAKGNKVAGKVKKGSEGMVGFQRFLGITPLSGNYGQGTHQAGLVARIPKDLAHGGDRVWDQFRINLYQSFDDMTAAEKTVTDIFSWWDWLVAREPSVHYSMDRLIQPLRDHENPPNLPSYLDCSGTCIYCAWLADALSPDSTYGFSGAGNTSSLIAGGFWIDLGQVNVVARDHYVLAFFGPSKYNTKHVTALKSLTRNYSMGKEAGPIVYDSVTYGRGDFIGVKAYSVI
jgi:hypothetical protein